jgi:hypothetical protein
MTDLLGALMALQTAVATGGAVRIVRTATDDGAGIVDHDTRTIHISPDLNTDDWLATLADGLRTLNAGRGDPIAADYNPVTADGARVIPMWPLLRLITDS